MSVTCRIAIRRGGIYIDAADFDRFFSGIEAVVLIRGDGDLHVLPLRLQAGGGLIVKRRNRAGDRVVDAAEFLRAQGIGDEFDIELDGEWSDAAAALIIGRLFACKDDLHNDSTIDTGAARV